MEEKDIFYVGIEDPDDMRKNLLDASGGVTEALERYGRFKEIRKERTQNVENLKRYVREISKLTSTLKEKLPKTGLGASIKKAGEKEINKKVVDKALPLSATRKKPKTTVKKEPEKKGKEKIELEKLKDELSDVEAKLNSLV